MTCVIARAYGTKMREKKGKIKYKNGDILASQGRQRNVWSLHGSLVDACSWAHAGDKSTDFHLASLYNYNVFSFDAVSDWQTADLLPIRRDLLVFSFFSEWLSSAG